MNQYIHMSYAQSIEELKLSGIIRNSQGGRSDDKNLHKLKKRSLNQYVPCVPKANYEGGGNSQGVKPTCSIGVCYG